MGNRNAGKTSLIEAITGITIPYAKGTHTRHVSVLTSPPSARKSYLLYRCPTEFRLSRSNTPWECTVSLHITTDSRGQAFADQSRIERFGPPIHYKGEVKDRIRRAQLAILNPSRPVTTFLNESEKEENGARILNEVFGEHPQSLNFSMNCVSLVITGPDVINLSFVDLPGQTFAKFGLVENLILIRSGCEHWGYPFRRGAH